MAKFYAVRKGLTPGIYKTWDECKAQVSGFPGTEYKSFPNEKDAFHEGSSCRGSACVACQSSNGCDIRLFLSGNACHKDDDNSPFIRDGQGS